MLFDFLIGMETQLTWYGHAAFKIKTATGKILLIDPWIENPAFTGGKNELASLDQVDLIFLTHGHSDHVGNTVEIGKRSGAKLVSNFDLNAAMVQHWDIRKAKLGMRQPGIWAASFRFLMVKYKCSLSRRGTVHPFKRRKMRRRSMPALQRD